MYINFSNPIYIYFHLICLLYVLGVIGSIIDEDGKIMREATIQISGSTHQFHVTRDNAILKIPLPVGSHELLVCIIS